MYISPHTCSTLHHNTLCFHNTLYLFISLYSDESHVPSGGTPPPSSPSPSDSKNGSSNRFMTALIIILLVVMLIVVMIATVVLWKKERRCVHVLCMHNKHAHSRTIECLNSRKESQVDMANIFKGCFDGDHFILQCRDYFLTCPISYWLLLSFQGLRLP